MKQENKSMMDFLKIHGINAHAKRIDKGSQRGTWRIWGRNQKWFDNIELQDKIKSLGFKDYDNSELTNFSGNGGAFQIFARMI